MLIQEHDLLVKRQYAEETIDLKETQGQNQLLCLSPSADLYFPILIKRM